LVAGQIVEIYNITKSLCGEYPVSEVLSPRQFRYEIPILKVTSASRTDNEATLVVDTTDGILVPFSIGQTVVVDISDNTYDNATATITDVTHKSISYANTGTNSAEASVTGRITVADVALSAVSSGSSKVYSRQVVSSSKKAITNVKRDNGYVWVWTKVPHGFKKNDKVLISFDEGAEEGRYKTLNEAIPVIVIDATNPNWFKYYQSTKTNNKFDIKSTGGGRIAVASPKKHTAVLATPISQLKLNTVDEHSYDEGDLIRVRGVDRPDWDRRIYDGYHKIVEVDTSQAASKDDVLKSTDYQIVSTNTARIWTDRNHGILPGDYVKISGFVAPVDYLNGKFSVTDSEDPDNATSGVANFDIQLSTDRTPGSKTASVVGKIVPYGSSYLIYDMPEYGPVSEPDNVVAIIERKYKKTRRYVTVKTDRRHNVVAGDRVKIDMRGSVFDGTYVIRSASTDTLVYQLPRGKTGLPTESTGWARASGSVTRVITKIGGIPTLETPINRVLVRANSAVIYSSEHDLQTGDPITIEFSSGYSALENNGNVATITSSDDNYFEYTVSPGTADVGKTTINAATISKNLATITTTTDHGYLAGQRLYIDGISTSYNGIFTIKNVTATNKFTYNNSVAKTAASGLTANSVAQSTLAVSSGVGYAYLNYRNLSTSINITAIESSSNVVTVTSADHGFVVGDYVFTYIDKKAYKNFRNGNEEVQITSVTNNTFAYTANPDYPTGTLGLTTVTGYATPAPQIDQEPVAISKTYGEFPSNANMGTLGFSTEEYSNLQYPNDTIRGGDLISVAEHLDRYTNTRDGFDYRIDCSLVEGQDNKKIFKRTFTFVPRRPEAYSDYLENQPGGAIPAGTYPPASALGADKIVFEYPGNIQNVNFSENASESATRVFVGGNNSDLGGDASSRYSASAATDLLQAGWPLLDRVEKVEWPLVGINQINVDSWGNYDSEADLQKTAERFLKESKPPTGDIIITVNGSLSPEIGTYNPGEWCSLLVDDEFVKQRMSSILEPRKDVIIRRIDGIKVQVPNSPAFPEMIDLELVTEWQVDEIGQ
jgi:dihydroneopterin aldolase